MCETDQCLFRIACKNMHHLGCGGYQGAPLPQSRPVDPTRDAEIIVKAVGQLATAHVRRALRPFDKRLARAKITGGESAALALRAVSGLMGGARRDSQ